jgi:hypothetical protein
MARHLGTVVIAEGVEAEEEATTLLELGVDVIQGYFFCPPQRYQDLDIESVGLQIDRAGAKYKERQLSKAGRKKINMSLYLDLIGSLQNQFAVSESDAFDCLLQSTDPRLSDVECLYVLDSTGNQITTMVFKTTSVGNRSSPMFRPLPIGADHSLRDYFYFLKDESFGRSTYVTKPYVSISTGSLCATIGARIQDKRGKMYILCLDVRTE